MSTFFQVEPRGWTRTPLKFLIEGSRNGAWGGEAGSDQIDSICVRVADFDWQRLRLDLSDPTIRSFGADQFRRLALRDGDLVLEKSGGGEKTPVGRVVMFSGEERSVTSNFVARVRPVSSVCPQFLLYMLAAQYMSGFAIQFVKQNTGIQNLDDTALFRSDVWVPDLNTQKAIADFLDQETTRIDQLIAKNSRFSKLLQERQTAKITAAVLGGIGSDGVWLADIPPDWKVERAKFHFRESQNRSETGTEELLTVSHITGVTKRAEKDVNMFLAESNEGHKLVEPGDLVINTMWAWMGAMGVSAENGLISPAYGVYRPYSGELRSAFVDLLVRSKPFVAEATRRSKGIHSSRLRLYPDAYLDMRLPIPPLNRQDEIIEEVVSATTREGELLRKNTRAIELLRERRAALITAAVTGQIDVTKWGKQGHPGRLLDRVEEASA